MGSFVARRRGAYVKWVVAQVAVSASFEHQHCGFQHPALVQPLLYSGYIVEDLFLVSLVATFCFCEWIFCRFQSL